MTFIPRTWQSDFLHAALDRFDEPREKNFLAAVCPGAGKTIGALLFARALLERGDVRRVVVVGHTDRIRTQWVEAAGEMGLRVSRPDGD